VLQALKQRGIETMIRQIKIKKSPGSRLRGARAKCQKALIRDQYNLRGGCASSNC
jgi:hypothetical protein